jgi:56kDa selenium binding protein (SBP56)
MRDGHRRPWIDPKGAPVEHRQDKPQSFHTSPAEALQAPAEEFLYLACLHEGTGVERPDFLAVIDSEDGRIAHETPMPNVGDELHHFGWNRCSSACHGPDRSHLIVPGFRSSRIHIVNVADDPRRPRIEKVIEPDELVAGRGRSRSCREAGTGRPAGRTPRDVSRTASACPQLPESSG